MELDISFLANVVGESSHALHFARASESRKKAMEIVFWNEEKGQWLDYWLNVSSNHKVSGSDHETNWFDHITFLFQCLTSF